MIVGMYSKPGFVRLLSQLAMLVFIDADALRDLALQQLQRESPPQQMIAQRVQLVKRSVAGVHPVKLRQHERGRFVRLAEAVGDDDFALLDAPPLDRVGPGSSQQEPR